MPKQPHRLLKKTLAFAIRLALVGTVFPTSAGPLYQITDLGSLGGTYSQATGINGSGQIVGYSDASGGSHAFVSAVGGGLTDLGTLGGTTSVASGINTNGQVVGYGNTTSGNTHAFVWSAAGGMTDLGTLGGASSFGTAINGNGQVVGYSDISGSTHAFTWNPTGGMTDLGTLGGTQSQALGINDKGQVVGNGITINGGVFDINANNNTLAGVHLQAGSITGTGGSLASLSNFDLQSGSVSANLNGNVGLDKTSTGTVTLIGVNTYTGPTTINAGSLVLSGGQAIADTNSVSIGAAGTLNLANNETIGSYRAWLAAK